MEIIEETIRYIDALHHQLAARLHSQNSNSTSEEQQNESRREGKKNIATRSAVARAPSHN